MARRWSLPLPLYSYLKKKKKKTRVRIPDIAGMETRRTVWLWGKPPCMAVWPVTARTTKRRRVAPWWDPYGATKVQGNLVLVEWIGYAPLRGQFGDGLARMLDAESSHNCSPGWTFVPKIDAHLRRYRSDRHCPIVHASSAFSGWTPLVWEKVGGGSPARLTFTPPTVLRFRHRHAGRNQLGPHFVDHGIGFVECLGLFGQLGNKRGGFLARQPDSVVMTV